ncbi:MAG: hypothetical protein M3O91_02325, partial [Chloroflexota bacterium]|nr:hypothetical protein [Chloroflexota bacterium]
MRIALRYFLVSLVALSAIRGGTARAADPDDGAWMPAPPGPPPGDIAEPAPAFGLDQRIAAGRRDIPPDVYLVTETYAGDEIVRDGALTTYRTVTASETPGTYARALDTVATGVPSAYDGAAFNGRATLSDGRAVAGTYYQTFLLTDERLVPVSVVFFQDDSELASRAGDADASIGTRARLPATGAPAAAGDAARS